MYRKSINMFFCKQRKERKGENESIESKENIEEELKGGR